MGRSVRWSVGEFARVEHLTVYIKFSLHSFLYVCQWHLRTCIDHLKMLSIYVRTHTPSVGIWEILCGTYVCTYIIVATVNRFLVVE